jgi:hypothetical protein
LMAGSKWFGDRRAAEISHGLAPGTAPWARMIDEKTDVAEAVRNAKASGAGAIKLYEHLDAAQVTRITREAKRQGLKVWSHATIFPAGPVDAIAAGVDSLSHSDVLIYAAYGPPVWESYRKLDWTSISPDAPAVVDLLRKMKREGVVLDPTLNTYDEIVQFEMRKKEEERDKWELARAEWAYAVTRLAHKIGVKIVAGTDFPERPRRRSFANIHVEMELLVTKAGMTPAEAIMAATMNGAELLGIEESYGTLSKGKVADIVILEADPMINIRNTRKLAYVIKGGHVHKPVKTMMPE